jgi:hypothetical protein
MQERSMLAHGRERMFMRVQKKKIPSLVCLSTGTPIDFVSVEERPMRACRLNGSRWSNCFGLANRRACRQGNKPAENLSIRVSPFRHKRGAAS